MPVRGRTSMILARSERPQQLWPKAAELVASTFRTPAEFEGGNWTPTNKQRRDPEVQAVAEVLAVNPAGAQQLMESFVRRAQLGLDVGLLRGRPPALDGKLLLGTDLQRLLLKVECRERRIELRDIIEVAAGVAAEGRDKSVPPRRCATLIFRVDGAMVLTFANEVLRNEFVLCLLILKDAMVGKSLRLESSSRDAEYESEPA